MIVLNLREVPMNWEDCQGYKNNNFERTMDQDSRVELQAHGGGRNLDSWVYFDKKLAEEPE